MSRIRAGNTLANQYAPPFSVSSSVASGWHLRWNDRLKAFEAYDPIAEQDLDTGFDNIQVYEIIATANLTQVTVPWQVPTKEALIVTINGVKQHQDAYHINIVNYGVDAMGVTFVVSELDEPIANGDKIEFLGLQASNPANIRVQSFLAEDYVLNQTTYTVSWVAPSKESLIVTVNGIRQHTSSYNITIQGASTRIIFFDDPGNGIEIPEPEVGQTGIWLEVVGILTTSSGNSNQRVEVANISDGTGTSYGLFLDKVDSGGVQLLNFRSLRAGTNIAITEQVDDSYVIAARSLSTIGAGSATLAPPVPGEDYRLRGIAGVDGETTVSLINDTITIGMDKGYVSTIGPTFSIPATARMVGVRGGPTTVTLPTPGSTSTPAGTRIVIKDEAGVAGATPITIDTASGNIDGQPTVSLTTAYAFITVYTDGTDWFRIG